MKDKKRAVERDRQQIQPPVQAGVKRWAKYLRRSNFQPKTVKNPERYLHAHTRRAQSA